MLIGELSKQSGLSRDTIRFYEKNGLITLGRRERRFNNYKEYSDEILQRLITIRRIKSFGFTLNEVAELLVLLDIDAATCDNVMEKFDDKLKKIDDKMQELHAVRALLLKGRQACSNSCCSPDGADENCNILLSELDILHTDKI